jgi:hypothetical protein
MDTQSDAPQLPQQQTPTIQELIQALTLIHDTQKAQGEAQERQNQTIAELRS